MDANQEKSDIRQRRQALGWSIYALARRAGLRWETTRDIESGKREPRAVTAAKIEAALAQGEGQGG